MTDRLYTTRTAGELLGGRHPNDVLVLIRQRKLRGVKQPVRGSKKPRYYVRDSDLNDYIKSLPDALDDGQSAPEPEEPPQGNLPKDVREELKRAKKYF